MQEFVPPLILRNRFLLEPMALKFRAHHFLYEVFNRKLQQYVEAGLNNYNTRWYNELYNPKRFEKYKEPFAILTLGELEAGFVVCMVPLILSIFVFAFEWILTMKDLMVLLFIFKTYFEAKVQEQNERGNQNQIQPDDGGIRLSCEEITFL